MIKKLLGELMDICMSGKAKIKYIWRGKTLYRIERTGNVTVEEIWGYC